MCCPLARVFDNPYHLSGVIFSMISTNFATAMWAAIVLANKDALSASNSRYAFVATYIPEDLIALFLGSIAVAQIICLWSHLRPTRFRAAGYGILSMWWSFVFFYNVTDPGPIYPTAAALSASVAFSAFYAWLDGQIDVGEDHHAPPLR